MTNVIKTMMELISNNATIIPSLFLIYEFIIIIIITLNIKSLTESVEIIKKYSDSLV